MGMDSGLCRQYVIADALVCETDMGKETEKWEEVRSFGERFC